MIQELTQEDSLNLLAHMRLGRLACSQGAQPYVVPSYFAYADNYLYSFATVGQKIEWMRANPLVCVEMDEVATSEEWVSIIIIGRYQELPDTPEWKKDRTLAYELLQQKANWWEPGYAKTIVHGTERPLVPVYFRIQILRVTGHHSAADSIPVADANSSTIDRANRQPILAILSALRKRSFSK
jgi:nitroimidazol reductase NimA-like FMN-containing flavoprotein (pyridoxamine 5'-phosphate oxidase superfamily)